MEVSMDRAVNRHRMGEAEPTPLNTLLWVEPNTDSREFRTKFRAVKGSTIPTTNTRFISALLRNTQIRENTDT
ncbi:hypothetical protein HG1285_01030 [Hydrogenivirga sp. 128-5-R1-1]|nr:hypothetical protein HG1285_01030 [Hydrogenivirga sp. 128-5-R1-1]